MKRKSTYWAKAAGRIKRRSSRRRRTGGPDRDVPKGGKVDLATYSCRLFRQPRNFRYVQKDYTSDIVPITGSNVAAVAGAYYFVATNLSNWTSFAAIYDQYRVTGIEFTLRPRFESISLSTTSNTPMRLVIDYDDATVLSSLAAAEEYSNCMTVEAYQSAKRVFCPAVAIAAYSGAFTSYANRQRQWIDVVSSSVQHYGLKWYIPISPTTSVPVWDVMISVCIEFKNVR